MRKSDVRKVKLFGGESEIPFQRIQVARTRRGFVATTASSYPRILFFEGLKDLAEIVCSANKKRGALK